MAPSPNIVYVFADQWRAQACGYAGNPNVHTPNLDKLAAESVNVHNAVAGCPVCSPYRASLLTGQYPLTHGVFVNDVRLAPEAQSFGKIFKKAGYQTAYIGKWHLDGTDRTGYIPPDRQHGFDYWKVLNCTHDYNNSRYYAHDASEVNVWSGYDAFAQTHDAQEYIRAHCDSPSPFVLMLSWGPPHAPYHTAPEEYRALYDPEKIPVRPNVPEDIAAKTKETLAGYYAHISALDQCVGWLLDTLKQCNIEDNTLFVFTSDHGDMLGCQRSSKKQQPWDESIRVPFLLRYPALLGTSPRTTLAVLDAPDIMPTLLSLSGVPVPETVEGEDFSAYLKEQDSGDDTDALLMCPHPFGQWTRPRGGCEYRGVRTPRYTYVETLDGPWLLYDNTTDPYQLCNLCGNPAYARIQANLKDRLQAKLRKTNDTFAPAEVYIRRLKEWGYPVQENGTVRYQK